MATLEQLYNTDINYYARVNFTSLIEIVDTLGGIDVNSEYAFEAQGYSFQKGVNHLNGKQALAFQESVTALHPVTTSVERTRRL